MNLLKISLFSILVAAGIILVFPADSAAQTGTKTPIHQLRIYEIPGENREVFHERFKDQAMRIMKKYGFRIIAIWESEADGKLEFIYLLEWKDRPAMEGSWKKFLADEEWKEIKRKSSEKYGTFVNEVREKTLILTDYSPRKTFFK